MNKGRCEQERAFTLAELLTAIGITALLAAVLLPVFASVRKKGQQTSCLSNLRQLHSACTAYAQDSDGFLPPYTSQATTIIGSGGKCVEQSRLLLDALHPYIKSLAVWRCPSDTYIPTQDTTSCSLPVTGLTSYHYAGYRLISGGVEPVSVDYKDARFESVTRQLLTDGTSCPNDSVYASYNHNGRWNRIFLDGHSDSFGRDCSRSPSVIETP